MKMMRALASAGVLAGLLIQPVRVSAQQYWDTDGATPGAGGATPFGFWSGANWSGSSAGTVGSSNYVSTNAVVFSAGTDATGVFVVSNDLGTVTVGNIAVEEGNVTLADGVINLGGSTRTITNVTPLTITSVITNTAGGITKMGVGVLTLRSSNSYTGNTTLGSGTAGYAGKTLVTASGALGSNGTLTINNTFNANMAVLQLSNSAVIGNNVTFANSRALPSAGGGAHIQSYGPGTNRLTGVQAITGTGGTGPMLESVNGLLDVAGRFTNTLSNNPRSVGFFGAGNGLVSGSINDGAGTSTMGVLKEGAGSWTLSGSNTFSGGVAIGAGTLILNNSNAVTAGSITVTNGSLQPGLNGGYVYRPLSLSALGTGSRGALYFNKDLGDISWNGNINLAGTTRIGAYSAGTTIRLGGVISGGGTASNLSFWGGGGAANHFHFFLLGNTNSYLSSTTIEGTFGGNSYVVLDGGDNRLPTNTTVNLVAGFQSGLPLTAALKLNGFNQTLAGLADSNSGHRRIINGSSTNAVLTLNTTSNTTFNGTLGGSGANDNNFGVVKTGASTWTLLGSNHTLSGGVTVQQGLLAVNGQLTNANIILAGGTLGGTGFVANVVATNAGPGLRPGASSSVPSIGTLTVSNLLFGHTSGTITNYLELNNVEYEGNDLIQVNGDVIWTNEVAFDLTAYAGSLAEATYTLVSYTGTPLASTNGLVVTGPATQSRSAFSLDVTTTPGAILLNVTPGPTSNLTWIGSGTNDVWTADAGGPLNWDGNALAFYNFDTVAFTETASVFTVTLSGNVSPGSVAVSGSSNYTFSGAGSIVGTGGLDKSGSGTLTLNTTNAFTGPVTISGGRVVIGAAGALGSGSSAVLISSPGALDFNGFGLGARAIQLDGAGPDGLGAVVNSGGVISTGTETLFLNGSATIGGLARWDIRRASLPAGGTQNVDLGTFTLTKVGTNEISLVNSRVGDGALAVADGLLTLSGTTTLSGSGTISVSNNATLGLFGAVTLGATSWPLSLNGGNLTEFGGGANNYGGTVTFENGTTNTIRALGSAQLTLGTLAGSGTFTFYGKSNQIALINNSGSFTGSGTIVTGIWQLAAAPTSLATYTVSGSLASLRMAANTTYAFSNLTINGFGTGADRLWGALVFDSGNTASPVVNSPITVASDAGIGTYGSVQTLTLNGVLSGPGGVTFGGRGGNAAGHTAVHILATTNVYGGATVIQNRDGVLSQTVRLGVSDALPVGTTLRLTNDNAASSSRAVLDLDGFNQTLAGLTAAPNGTVHTTVISTGAVSVLTITNPVASFFGGGLGLPGAGNFSLVKDGAGTLTVGSSNHYSGTTTVNGGRLVLNGAGVGTGLITVGPGASLGGTGFVSGVVSLQSTATLAPGNPAAAGTFRVSNALDLASGAVYAWDYTGATNDAVDAVAVTFGAAWTLDATAAGITNGSYVLFRTTSGVTNFVAPTLVGVTGTVTLAGNDVVLTVGDLSTPFQSWQTLNFGSTTNANAAYDQDPDGDGANNLLEYAFGSAPTNGGSVSLPQTGTSGDFLTITVPRNSNATDISYVVQGSSNLLDWATNVVLTATNPAPAGSTVTYTNGTANSALPQQFLRVNVTLP